MHSYQPVSNKQAMACMLFYCETRKHAVHIREGLTYRPCNALPPDCTMQQLMGFADAMPMAYNLLD